MCIRDRLGGEVEGAAESHYGLSPDAFVMVEIVDGDWQLIAEE